MIATTLKGAVAWLFIFDRAFFKALTAPVLLFLIFGAVDLLTASVADPFPGFSALVFCFKAFLVLAASTLVAIVVHRTVLLGRLDEFGFGFFWSMRESWFALHLVGLMVISISALLLIVIPVVGPLLVLPAMGYLMARFSLVFPAIATNRGMSFGMSWRLTRRHKIDVFIILALVPWLACLPLQLLPQTVYLLPFDFLLNAVLTIYLTTTLSLLYQQIVEMERSEAAESGQA